MGKATLPELDNSLYPQVWEQQTFDNAQTLLMAMLLGKVSPDPYLFTKQLQANDTYQEWITASIFGRYIQHSFAALYGQSEDSFNRDIPVLFRNELMRHTQYLPLEQIVFMAGNMPKKARQERFFTTTLNPATVIVGAQKLKHDAGKSLVINRQAVIINQIRVASKRVLGFPLRHNKRTSERIRNEVLILGFDDLRLVDEHHISHEIMHHKVEQKTASTAILANTDVLLRCYELR